MQYSSNEAGMMNHQPKQDCLPITPHRRESSSVASAGAATFHDDSADPQMFVKLDLTSRRESLQLDQLNSFKKSYRKKRMEESRSGSVNGKSFTSSWQSSLGSSISSVFSSIRSLNIVVLDDEAVEDPNNGDGHAFPRIARSNVNESHSMQRQLQWQRSESVGAAGGLQPKMPKRRSSWGWKKSSLHSNATSSAGTKSRRSSLRSSLTSWTPSRSRRSSSGSITTQTPEEQLHPRYYSGEQDTFPLRPWRRASLAASIPVERILEGGELEEQGSSNMLLGLSNHSTNHHRHPGAEEEGSEDSEDSDNDEEPPVARCSETTQKITNAAITATRPSYMWDDIEEEEASGCSSQLALDQPTLTARASAATVKATNSDYSSSMSGRRPYDEDSHSSPPLMKGCKPDDSVACRWANSSSSNFNLEERGTTAGASSNNPGSTTSNCCHKDQGLSMPIRLDSAHTTTSTVGSSGGASYHHRHQRYYE